MLIECDINKGGCKNRFEINPDSVKGDRYIQCPACGRFIENPFFEEEYENKETRSYLG